MNDIASPPVPVDHNGQLPATEKSAELAVEDLSNAEKAAIILGVLGTDGAAPILEQLDEELLRSFAGAMSRLKTVAPETVTKTIAEFLYEVDRLDMTVLGGSVLAKDMLRDLVNEATMTKIFDEIESPSVHNVWNKLGKIDDDALAEFLDNEHPQTVAVVLSKLPAEHAARLLGRMDEQRAQMVVHRLTTAAKLDPQIIETIGSSVSRDFLKNQRGTGSGFKPAERIGSILNYAPGNIRQSVLTHMDETQPELSEEVRKKMFTFQDIPNRIEKRDIAAIVRATNADALLQALGGAADNAVETRDFILSSISSRVAEQLRADIADQGKVKIRDAEEAQNAILTVIREMEATDQLKLIAIED